MTAIDSLVDLLTDVRPDWERWLVRSVLTAHEAQVHVADLTIAAMRAARNPDVHNPRVIGWRGPHWRDLETVPPEAAPLARCDTCGKPEDRCLFERPGRDDDHEFRPR